LFPEPWIDPISKVRLPGFEIFFDCTRDIECDAPPALQYSIPKKGADWTEDMDDALAQMFEELELQDAVYMLDKDAPDEHPTALIKAAPMENWTAVQGPIADKAQFMEEFGYIDSESDDECLRQPCSPRIQW